MQTTGHFPGLGLSHTMVYQEIFGDTSSCKT